MVNLSVITATYNSEATIEEFLSSLIKDLPSEPEIIIVDNNSQDKTKDKIKEFKEVSLLENTENQGFSKANNQGAWVSRGKYLLFLNPDVEVKKGSIKELLDYLTNHQEVGLIAPKLMIDKDNVQTSVRKLPTLKRAIKEYLFGKVGEYSEYAPMVSEPIEVECVYGAVMLVPRGVFEDVGGFDERYFLYMEDIDLCRKIKREGLKIIYDPKALFYHQVGTSMKTLKTTHLPFGIRTLALYYPMKQTGSYYYQVKSGNIYFGVFRAFLIRLIMYLGRKFRI